MFLGSTLLLSLACARGGSPAVHAQPRATTPAPEASDIVTTIPVELGGQVTFVPAAINGRHGMFMLDLGAFPMLLHQQYWRYTHGTEIDTLVDPRDSIPTANALPHARVQTVQLGAFVHHVAATDWGTTSVNAQRILGGTLAYLAPNLSPAENQPALGNLGLINMVPYEAIFDYPGQRLTLIRVDSMGRRLGPVPEFTPVETIPLVSGDEFQHIGIEVQIGTVKDTFYLDTGAPFDKLTKAAWQRLRGHVHTLPPGGPQLVTVDTIRIGNRTLLNVPFRSIDLQNSTPTILGYDFLQQLGVFGINCRARQLLLYRVP